VFDNSIAIVDVSGSMEGIPMTVAIALGLLSCGPWNENQVISFSSTPKLHVTDINSSLYDQVNTLKRIDWGMNTNVSAAIDLVKNLPKIKRLYIFSDMQFDDNFDHDTNIEIVYWNLRGSTGDFPIQSNNKGVTMLSGYSPSLLTSLLGNEELTPLSIMFKTIHSERYSKVMAP